VVHQHTPDDYEVEFADEEGDTIDVLALRMDQFIIVWRAKTGQWVSVSKQVSDMIERLPNDAALEVLDFTRYVSVRSRGPVKPDMPA
jgi:hypothetical protein